MNKVYSVVYLAALCVWTSNVISGSLQCGPEPGREFQEGAQPRFWCEASIPDNGDEPILQWYKEQQWMNDTYEDLNSTEIVRKIATFNGTLTPHDHQLRFSCLQLALKTNANEPKPSSSIAECDTYINVQYAPYDMQFDPDPADYEGQILNVSIGDTINCTASARPEADFEWEGTDNLDYRQGPTLVIQDPGSVTDYVWKYKCRAKNKLWGQQHSVTREVQFRVAVEGEEKEDSTDEDEAWLIPFVLLIIVLLVGIVLAVVSAVKYVRDSNRPRKLEESGDGAQPSVQHPAKEPTSTSPGVPLQPDPFLNHNKPPKSDYRSGLSAPARLGPGPDPDKSSAEEKHRFDSGIVPQDFVNRARVVDQTSKGSVAGFGATSFINPAGDSAI